MSPPRILDLFCKAGGAGMGYHRAGFEVIGVDIEPQPRYPFEFIRQDALTFDPAWIARNFDAVHASPPCQAFTVYRNVGRGVGDGYPDLLEPTRTLLRATSLPYIIENVEGAPLLQPVRLCGSSFRLDIRRHRLFESNVFLMTPPCNHAAQEKGRYPASSGRAKMSRATIEVGAWRVPLALQKAAMQIDWMTLPELSQAIPPAYTEFLGRALLAQLDRRAAA